MNDDRAVDAVDHTDLEQVRGLVRADEHGDTVVKFFDEDRVVEGMENVVVTDAVSVSARGDQRSIHWLQVSLEVGKEQDPCRAVPCRAALGAGARRSLRLRKCGRRPGRASRRRKRGPSFYCSGMALVSPSARGPWSRRSVSAMAMSLMLASRLAM